MSIPSGPIAIEEPSPAPFPRFDSPIHGEDIEIVAKLSYYVPPRLVDGNITANGAIAQRHLGDGNIEKGRGQPGIGRKVNVPLILADRLRRLLHRNFFSVFSILLRVIGERCDETEEIRSGLTRIVIS